MVYFYRHDDKKIKETNFSKKIKGENKWKENWIIFKQTFLFKIFIWFVIPIVFFNFWVFRYDDFSNNCHIKIKLSLLEWNNLRIKTALKFIRNNSPDYYRKVCSYVDVISPDLPCGGPGGGCFRTGNPKQIEISVQNHRDNPSFTAAMIIHETCHSIQYQDKNGALNESECYHEMNNFLGELNIDSPWKNYQ